MEGIRLDTGAIRNDYACAEKGNAFRGKGDEAHGHRRQTFHHSRHRSGHHGRINRLPPCEAWRPSNTHRQGRAGAWGLEPQLCLDQCGSEGAHRIPQPEPPLPGNVVSFRHGGRRPGRSRQRWPTLGRQGLVGIRPFSRRGIEGPRATTTVLGLPDPPDRSG